MNRKHLYLAASLLAVGSFWAGKLVAQSPFDGTWKVEPSKSTRDTKPSVFYIAQGWYHCESCVPPIVVKADGTDQTVTDQALDTLSIKEVDAKTIAAVGKKNGKVAFEATSTVSADGKSLTEKGVTYPPNGDKPVNWTTTYKRVGIAPMGVHATSGQWMDVKDEASENGLLTTYKTNGDELTLTRPTGETYTAKFDGNEYPVKGAYGYDTVSLKRLGDRSFEETDKLKGKVVEVDTWTVSNDGRILTVVAIEKPSERKFTVVSMKVPQNK